MKASPALKSVAPAEPAESAESAEPAEIHGYLPSGPDGDVVYHVRHRCVGDCRGAVVLAGPIGLERTHAYSTGVRWARHLARNGFDVLRFDYRGLGESTGRLADFDLHSWVDDIGAAASELASARPDVPLTVHGIRGGALLAARAFDDRIGDRLLLWEPPQSGRAMFTEILRRKLASDYAQHVGGDRKTRESYILDLEAGSTVEAEGYDWSPAWWRSAQDFPLIVPTRDGASEWMIVHLDGRAADRHVAARNTHSVRVPKPPFWGESKWIRPDLSELFDLCTDWLRQP